MVVITPSCSLLYKMLKVDLRVLRTSWLFSRFFEFLSPTRFCYGCLLGVLQLAPGSGGRSSRFCFSRVLFADSMLSLVASTFLLLAKSTYKFVFGCEFMIGFRLCVGELDRECLWSKGSESDGGESFSTLLTSNLLILHGAGLFVASSLTFSALAGGLLESNWSSFCAPSSWGISPSA